MAAPDRNTPVAKRAGKHWAKRVSAITAAVVAIGGAVTAVANAVKPSEHSPRTVVSTLIVHASVPSTASAATCPTAIGDGARTFEVQQASDEPILRAVSGVVRVAKSTKPSADFYGRLEGAIASGTAVYAAAQSDPATRDSTPDRHPGTGGIYPGQVVEIGADGCFSILGRVLGYSDAQGLGWRIYLMLVPQSALNCLEQIRQWASTKPPALSDYTVCGAKVAATFYVQT